MKAFHPSMFPSRARVLPLVSGNDADAGPTESASSPGPLIPCRLRATGRGVADVAGQDRPTTTFDVALPDDPGASLDWSLEVVSPVPMTLRCLGPARARDSDGALWVLPCELVD